MVRFIDHSPDAGDRNGEATGSSPHGNEEVNGKRNASSFDGEGHKKKRKNKDRGSKDGERQPIKKRRHSLSKAARDPRDEASPIEADVGTRSPSPVIDFDGLSRPSKFSTSTRWLLSNRARSRNP
jgi:GTP cyclohydrolase IA